MSENAAPNPKQRDNAVELFLTLKMKSVGDALRGKQILRDLMMKLLVTESPTWRNKMIEMFSQEDLDEAIVKYSITIPEHDEIKKRNAEEKRLKEQAKIEREERLIKAKEETLRLRKEKLQAEKEKPQQQPTEDPETKKAREALEAEFGTQEEQKRFLGK